MEWPNDEKKTLHQSLRLWVGADERKLQGLLFFGIIILYSCYAATKNQLRIDKVHRRSTTCKNAARNDIGTGEQVKYDGISWYFRLFAFWPKLSTRCWLTCATPFLSELKFKWTKIRWIEKTNAAQIIGKMSNPYTIPTQRFSKKAVLPENRKDGLFAWKQKRSLERSMLSNGTH